jgi:hypothetical protein
MYGSQDILVSIVTRLQAGRSEFDSWQGQGIFLFATMSRLALEPTQTPIHWVPGVLFLEVKWPGCEADHLPPSSAKVKNAWSYTSTPPRHLRDMVLSYTQGYLYLLLSVFSFPTPLLFEVQHMTEGAIVTDTDTLMVRVNSFTGYVFIKLSVFNFLGNE